MAAALRITSSILAPNKYLFDLQVVVSSLAICEKFLMRMKRFYLFNVVLLITKTCNSMSLTL